MNRRLPPPFLAASVTGRAWLTPRLARVTLQGPDLQQLEVTQPASSVRVLLPSPDRPGRLEMPEWDGNRFVRPGGGRPRLRTLTPVGHDRAAGVLHLDVVVHGAGAAARWAEEAGTGTPVALSGPARGYGLDPEATAIVVGGDETAYAAVCQIVEAASVPVTVYLEVGTDERPPLPSHPDCQVEWLAPAGGAPGQAVASALGRARLLEGAHLWAAGEAAAMQQLRRILFEERGVARNRAVVRGYWKHGRSSEEEVE